ncbi:MAG: TPM domain-containing protein [Deltaproteobacteria bacterium]|nr:TPM domain-containing protein [Deltaproteobacteria bacterium]
MRFQGLSPRSRFHSGPLRPTGKPGCLLLALMALWMIAAPRPALVLPLESLGIGSSAVLDTAGVLKEEECQALEQRLRDLHQRQLMQAAVVTVDSTDGIPIFDYGMKIAEKWQLGEADRDNGLLILIAVKDRKFHTFTGRGLEGVLTDVSLTRIQRDAFPPNFRNGNYARGIDQALDGMEKRLTADEQSLKKLLAEDRKEIEGGLLENILTYGLVTLCLIGCLALCLGLPVWAIESSCGIRRSITAPIVGLILSGIALGLDLGPVAAAIAGVAGFVLYIPFAWWLTRIDKASPSSGGSRGSSGFRSGGSSRSSGGSSRSSRSYSGGYRGGGGRFGGGGSGGGW